MTTALITTVLFPVFAGIYEFQPEDCLSNFISGTSLAISEYAIFQNYEDNGDAYGIGFPVKLGEGDKAIRSSVLKIPNSIYKEFSWDNRSPRYKRCHTLGGIQYSIKYNRMRPMKFTRRSGRFFLDGMTQVGKNCVANGVYTLPMAGKYEFDTVYGHKLKLVWLTKLKNNTNKLDRPKRSLSDKMVCPTVVGGFPFLQAGASFCDVTGLRESLEGKIKANYDAVKDKIEAEEATFADKYEALDTRLRQSEQCADAVGEALTAQQDHAKEFEKYFGKFVIDEQERWRLQEEVNSDIHRDVSTNRQIIYMLATEEEVSNLILHFEVFAKTNDPKLCRAPGTEFFANPRAVTGLLSDQIKIGKLEVHHLISAVHQKGLSDTAFFKAVARFMNNTVHMEDGTLKLINVLKNGSTAIAIGINDALRNDTEMITSVLATQKIKPTVGVLQIIMGLAMIIIAILMCKFPVAIPMLQVVVASSLGVYMVVEGISEVVISWFGWLSWLF